MRLREFNLTEDELFELKMSPGRLAQMVKDIDARAGMEFELIVPGVEDSDDEEYQSEPDYDADESFPTGRGWQRDVMNFFRGGDMSNSTRSIQNALEDLNGSFLEWVDENQEEYINSDEGRARAIEIARDNVDTEDYENDPEGAIRQYLEQNDVRIRDELINEYNDDLDSKFEEWLDDQDIRTMSQFGDQFGLDWPYWSEPEYNSGGGVATIADDFSRAIGRPAISNTKYHGDYSTSKERWADVLKKSPNSYVVEPDGSLNSNEGETGLEFVSPPLTVDEMLSDIDKVAKWADRVGAYTNRSTGLHMNVSVPNQQNLDYVKLAMFLGDNYILEQFGREANSYCRSALNQIQQQARQNPDRVEEMLRQFQNGLNQLASKLVHTGSTEKFTSINNRGDWIEFRSPGGDWLDEDLSPVKNTLLRTVVALDIATKPEAFKQEYYKKLVKTLQNPVEFIGRRGEQQQRQDPVEEKNQELFSNYIAAVMTDDKDLIRQRGNELKSFIKQLQTKRQAGKKEPDSTASSSAASQSHPEGRGRPHDPNGRYAIVSREDPAAYQTGRGMEPEYLFRFNMSDPAGQHNGRYILQAWAARNTVDPANYMVVDAERWDTPAPQQQQMYEVTYTVNDGTQTSTNNVRTLASNATAAMDQVRTNLQRQGQRVESIDAEPVSGSGSAPARGSDSLPPGNARWRILDRNDQEVYSFVNTTAQIDANRYAHQWLISNGDPARAPFMVVPVT